MNIVKLPSNLLAVNAAIQGRSQQLTAPTAPVAEYGGTIHNGYNEVIAQVAPGLSGKVCLTFKMAFPSVTAFKFRRFRLALNPILGSLRKKIDIAAGIDKVPPPVSTYMAAYASKLFSEVIFDGKDISQADVDFPPPAAVVGIPHNTLSLVRMQPVKMIRMSGALSVEAKLKGKTARVYVPITAITFSDGLVIPFAGYAQHGLLATDGHYAAVPIPDSVWTH